jgi:hypothetical protein
MATPHYTRHFQDVGSGRYWLHLTNRKETPPSLPAGPHIRSGLLESTLGPHLFFSKIQLHHTVPYQGVDRGRREINQYSTVVDPNKESLGSKMRFYCTVSLIAINVGLW